MLDDPRPADKGSPSGIADLNGLVMMEKKVGEVRDLLGDTVKIKDSEIRETLWYYYYDVDRTVSWFLGPVPAILY